MVNDEVEVFAISCSSFLDDPSVVEDEEKRLPTEPLLYDVNITVKGQPNARASRNRNIALSLFHPAVRDMLKRL